MPPTDRSGESGAFEQGSRSADPAVLIPSGRKMKSYGCMRSLRAEGARTIVASEYERIPHFSSRYCSEAVRLSVPPDRLVAYKDALLEIASRPDVETVVPVREVDVYLFAKYRDEFDEHVSLVSPDLETLRTVHDRRRLAAEAEKAGVPTADTRLLSEVDEWDSNLVIKSRFNLLTDEYVDCWPPDTATEMKDVRFVTPDDDPDEAEIRAEMHHEPIVQEFVRQSDKHLYCALWDDGEPVATYQHEQIRQNSWVGGGGVYRVSTRSEAVEEAAADLLSRLNWTGFACIEYLRDEETGEWKFLEVNPRVWQSMPEAVRAGADFPAYYWRCARGEADRIDHDYETGIACHSSYGEVAHLRSVRHDDSPLDERPSFAGTLREIATSCVRHPRFDYIRLDDPRFFLSAAREALSSGVTSSRQYGTAAAGIAPTTDESDESPEPATAPSSKVPQSTEDLHVRQSSED